MNRSSWKATPAVGFSQVSKVGRGSCSCRSASTARHSDLASGSACMLLSQTGILSVSSPPGSYPGRCLSAWSSGLACLRSSAALAALAFFSCRVHSPRLRLYQWMALLMSSHLPLIQGPELPRQHVDLVLCLLWRVAVRSDSRLPAVRLLALCGSGSSAVTPGGLSSPGPGGSFPRDSGEPGVSGDGGGDASGGMASSRLPGVSRIGRAASSPWRGA